MGFTLAVATERGEVLRFDCYGATERLTALAAARDQSAKEHTPWTEVWEGEKLVARYQHGYPAPGSSTQVWHDNNLAISRHGNYGATYAREALRRSYDRLGYADSDDDEDWEWSGR